MGQGKHKAENKCWMRAEQGRRRSNVAQPHRDKSKYDRRDSKREKRRQEGGE